MSALSAKTLSKAAMHLRPNGGNRLFSRMRATVFTLVIGCVAALLSPAAGEEPKPIDPPVGQMPDNDPAKAPLYRLLRTLDESPEADKRQLAGCLVNLARLSMENPDHYGEAIALGERARGVLEKDLLFDDALYLFVINLLSTAYVGNQDIVGGETMWRSAISAVERGRGGNAHVYPFLLSGLAACRLYAGDGVESVGLLEKALAAGEKLWGGDNPLLCDFLVTYGMSKAALDGDFDIARENVSRALSIAERGYGRDDAKTMTPLANLGVIYTALGDYREAERYLRRASGLAQGSGLITLEAANAHTALSISLAERGDFRGAEKQLTLAMAIERKLGTQGRSGLVNSQLLLSRIKMLAGSFHEAAEINARGIEAALTHFGGDYPLLATFFADAGRYSLLCGNLDAALDNYVEASRIADKTQAIRNPLRLDIAAALAECRFLRGQVDEAEDDVARLSAFADSFLGQSHPLRRTLDNLSALTKYFRGQCPEALAAAREAVRRSSIFRESAFAVSSERQRLDFVGGSILGGARYAGMVMANLAVWENPEKHAAAQAFATHVLRDKGAVLDSLMKDRELARASSEAQILVKKMNQDKQSLTRLALHPPASDDGVGEYRRGIEALEASVAQTERDLAQMTDRLRENNRTVLADPVSVSASLPEDSMLIEFAEAALLPEPGTAKNIPPDLFRMAYFAVIIRPETASAECVLIGEKKPIDELVQKIQRAMRSGTEVFDDLKLLYGLVWAPLHGKLGDFRRVFISPAGELNFLPFSVLMTPDDSYLAEEYTLSYVSSGRDLLRRPSTGDGGAEIFADPEFVEGAGAETDYFERSGAIDQTMFSGLLLPRLPATRDEAYEIKELFSASGKKINVWLGVDASKDRVQGLKNPGILHFATHGFYLSASSVPSVLGGRAAGSAGGNPMWRSGLVLSRASSDGSVPNDSAGILTAEEVALLDLSGTNLVVLSSCDSGSGELSASEGVMGLRRAFVQAGATDLVMTLWTVDDAATARLMVGFYQNYLTGMPLDSALTEMQRKEIRTSRSSGSHSAHPRYWAPFVASFQGSMPMLGK